MPEIEIRPAISADIPALIAIDHHFTSENVWQMEIQQDESQIAISFREVRLPRSVRVDYPRSPGELADTWTQRSGVLVALLEGEPIGYATLMLELAPLTTWMTDLVVTRRLRRQGIAERVGPGRPGMGRRTRQPLPGAGNAAKERPGIKIGPEIGVRFLRL